MVQGKKKFKVKIGRDGNVTITSKRLTSGKDKMVSINVKNQELPEFGKKRNIESSELGGRRI